MDRSFERKRIDLTAPGFTGEHEMAAGNIGGMGEIYENLAFAAPQIITALASTIPINDLLLRCC